MATNFIAVNQLLSKNSLASMVNKLVFTKTVNRDLDSQWTNDTNGFRQGDSYKINRPARFRSVVGNSIGSFDPVSGTWNTGSFVEDPIFLTVTTNDQKNISAQFNSKELTLALSNEKSRLGEPVGKQLANDLEQKLVAESITHGGMYVLAKGNTTLGTKIGTADLLDGQALLDAMTAPQMDRSTLIPPFAMAQLSRENLNLFTPTVNDNQVYPTGYIKEFAGSDMFSYNLLPVYSVPAIAGPLTLTANVLDGAATVSFSAAGADIGKVLPAGTILEFDAYEFVNPASRQSVGVKYSFAITAPVTLAASNTVTIDDAAKIYGPADVGNRQDITALPVIGDTLTVVGADTTVAKSYYQVVMYNEDAYTATIIPLTTDLPGAYAARADYEGYSVRTSVQTVIGSDTVVHRFDVFGKGILQRDQYAVRILVEK